MLIRARSDRDAMDALAALQVQRDRQAFERQALGDPYADHGLVFATPRGTPLDRENMTKWSIPQVRHRFCGARCEAKTRWGSC
jgi:hypothetical protein